MTAHAKAMIEREIPPNKLALRSWIATNEALIVGQWEIVERHGRLPLSTGSLECKIGEWLVQIKRRAGRWQNARRLNIALGLITLRARGEAREARYAGIVRALFASCGNASHLLWENGLPSETLANGKVRQMGWWRTWHDPDEPSLPRLVRDAERNTVERPRRDTLETTPASSCRSLRRRQRPASPVRDPDPTARAAQAATEETCGWLGRQDEDRRHPRAAGRLELGLQPRPRPLLTACQQQGAHFVALRAQRGACLGNAYQQADLRRLVLSLSYGQCRPPRRVVRGLLPRSRRRLAPDEEYAAAVRDQSLVRQGSLVAVPPLRS